MNISAVFFRLLPYLLLVGGAFGLQEQPQYLKLVPEIVLKNLPFIVAAIGGAFAWFFRRGNIAIALTFSALCYLILDLNLNSKETVFVAGFIALLIPFNALLVSLWEERGVLTSPGIAKMMFMGLQLGAVVLITFGDAGRHIETFLPVLFIDPIGLYFPYMPQAPFVAIFMFLLVGLWMLFISFRKGLPVETAWLFYLIACGAAVIFGLDRVLFFSVATIGLVIGVIQDSYRMAFLDELTGIPARRALISDMKKLGSRYVVAMADIDHFKKFNDTHGHDVGDQVLRMVATNMTKVTGGGQAYRYGGEEFTILFPNKSIDEAMEHLERVRQRIENASFTIRGKDRPKKKPKKGQKAAQAGDQVVRVTSSFGAAERSKERPQPMIVMKGADEALYRAKKAGRNQVSK